MTHAGVWGVCIATAIGVAACGTARGPVDDASLNAQLGLLSRPGVSRHELEARLGNPSQSYEQGAVVSYRLYLEDKGQLTTNASGQRASYYTLMLHYGPDGRLLRYSLLEGLP
jgi:hypothetical protein